MWVEEQLKEGIKVLSITHQNVLDVSSLFPYGFSITNRDKLVELFNTYGVEYNFSGHSHIQTTIKSDTLTDYVTGSLTVSPLNYGIINVNEDSSVNYQVNHVDILNEEARERFISVTRSKIAEDVNTLLLSDEIKEAMIDYAVEINIYYFAGDKDTLVELSKRSELNLWKEHGSATFWGLYLNSILEELE